MIFGFVYLLVGIAGFIPALGGTAALSPPSNLLGTFSINVVHNIVHLIIGFFGISLSRTEGGGAAFCGTFGVILIVIGIVGFFWPLSLNASLLPIRGVDVWLHLVTGLILAAVGFGASRAAA